MVKWYDVSGRWYNSDKYKNFACLPLPYGENDWDEKHGNHAWELLPKDASFRYCYGDVWSNKRYHKLKFNNRKKRNRIRLGISI